MLFRIFFFNFIAYLSQYRMEPQLMPLIEEKQIPKKYAIIAAGRMGHGKSSFTRMIASEEIKKTIQVSSSTKSVTNECSLYPSNLLEMGAGEQLVVIDTPGIDSKNAIYVIAEQIDNMILQHKLNVIGIAYVLDIKQRDQNQQGESYIFTFLQILRIRYTHKVNLSFPILSKFDRYYDEMQDNQHIFSELRQIFKSKGFLTIWDRHILWINEPQYDRQRFIKKIKRQQECEAIYKNQFLQLKKIILNAKENKEFLSHQQILNNKITFQKKLMEGFQQNYDEFQLSNQIKDIQVIVQIKKQGLKGNWINNFRFLTQKLGLVVASRSVIITAVAVAVAAAGAVALIMSPFTNWYKSNVKKRDTQIMLNGQLSCKLLCLMVELASKYIKLNQQKLQFQERDFINIDKCTNKEKQLGIKRENDSIARITLQPGENIVKFKSRLPTNHQMLKLIEKLSREYYNCKEQEELK